MDKIKLNIKGIEEGLKKTTEAMNAILETKPYGLDIEAIVKDIRERQDNAIAMEFTKRIGELLKKNGVVPKLMEYTRNFETDNTFETRYGVSITELDFSEHDKRFIDEIMQLKQRIAELESKETENVNEIPDSITIDGYKCKIIKTESGLYISRDEIYSIIDKEKEPLKQKCKELEDRHQSDCIEINRLNTTIDVLIHKVEYLRQFAGLE